MDMNPEKRVGRFALSTRDDLIRARQDLAAELEEERRPENQDPIKYKKLLAECDAIDLILELDF